jgi:glycosyltransferase involved in cell wall biosynthesis
LGCGRRYLYEEEKGLKVLVIPSWYPPYGGGFIQEQAEALAEMGNDVTVLAIERISPRAMGQWLKAFVLLFLANYTAKQEGRLKVIRAQVPGLPRLPKIYAQFFSSKVSRCFFRYAKLNVYQPNVMHVHSLLWGGLAAAKIKKETNIPYLVTEHRGRFVDNQYVNAGEKQEMALPELVLALSEAAKVLCVSSLLIPYLRKRVANAELDVLANMVDVAHFTSSSLERTETETFQFICVANMVPLKGHETLLNALSKLVQCGSNVHLTLVGDGWHRSYIQQHAKNLNLCEHVTFTGHLSRADVKQYLNAADAFVLPSQYEAFGIVYIEAMSMGLPVIATHSGGAVDFVNSDNGVLIDSGNEDALYKAMERLMTDISKYDRLGISEYVLANFSKSVIAKKLNRELENIIGQL